MVAIKKNQKNGIAKNLKSNEQQVSCCQSRITMDYCLRNIKSFDQHFPLSLFPIALQSKLVPSGGQDLTSAAWRCNRHNRYLSQMTVPTYFDWRIGNKNILGAWVLCVGIVHHYIPQSKSSPSSGHTMIFRHQRKQKRLCRQEMLQQLYFGILLELSWQVLHHLLLQMSDTIKEKRPHLTDKSAIAIANINEL